MGFHMIDDDPWTKCQAKPSQHFLYKVAKKGEEKKKCMHSCHCAQICKWIQSCMWCLSFLFYISYIIVTLFYFLYYCNSAILSISGQYCTPFYQSGSD